MIVDPHKTRGCVAMPGEAAKVPCSNQNFVGQNQVFLRGGTGGPGPALVPPGPVRPSDLI